MQPQADPQEVHLTVSPVRYNFKGIPRRGVCSTYLADRSPGDEIAIYVRTSKNFRPPSDPTTPMIMIGPGTGIAPFRGFLQERRALGHTGGNWLFFGEQHAATDYYYREEIEQMRADGFLTELDLAFSRDQREKVYVQHLMRNRGAQLWQWLQDGAQLYVCGNADPMAKDVDRTLLRDRGRTRQPRARCGKGLRPLVDRRQALPPRRLLSIAAQSTRLPDGCGGPRPRPWRQSRRGQGKVPQPPLSYSGGMQQATQPRLFRTRRLALECCCCRCC